MNVCEPFANVREHSAKFFLQITIVLLCSKNLMLDLLFLMQEHSPGDVQAYNNIVIHETLRVAICNNLDGQHKFPSKLL